MNHQNTFANNAYAPLLDPALQQALSQLYHFSISLKALN